MKNQAASASNTAGADVCCLCSSNRMFKGTAELVQTKPFEGQKPGTSGLRKATKVFQQPNYVENFIQSYINAGLGDNVQGCSLVVGGDGRYLLKEVVDKIIRIAAANGVAKVYIGQNGIFSTPAISHVIRKYKLLGGVILTASHNPGGIDADFGIKFNISNGGPAPDAVTESVYKETLSISSYKIVPTLPCDISKIGSTSYEIDGRKFEIEVICSVTDYVNYMKEIFDFLEIKKLLHGVGGKPPLKVLINCLNGVTGPYIEKIFVDEFGISKENLKNITPLPDFGGLHPDPNLTYAADLVNAMKNGDYDFGAAFDGDGDRNMILGEKAFFVTPSDSVAVLAHYLDYIPFFRTNGVKGYARSMPTSAAIDRVAAKKGKECFQVPTGWKYFGNLMDAGRLSLCGEESFGTGSDHIREKDGVWACLAWLNVLAAAKKTIPEILKEHWATYGRNFYTRYDYENCEAEPCNQMMSSLDTLSSDSSFIGKQFTEGGKSYKVAKVENYSYTDPVDGSVASKQGIIISFDDGSRVVFRLSGTGSSGATIRMYIEGYEPDTTKHALDAQDILKPLVEIGLKISQLRELTGRKEPSVIT